MAGFGGPPSSLCCGSLWAVLVCFSCFNGVLRGSSGVLWATLGPMGSGLAPDSLAVRRRVNCISVAALYFTIGNPVFGFGLRPEQFYLLALLPFYLFRAFLGVVPGRRRRVKVLRNKLFGTPLLTSNVIVRGHFLLNFSQPLPGFILFPDPYPL